jgi:hypothetical protein
MRPQKRIETIELVIPAGSTATKFNFGDIPQLRSDVTKDIIVRSIESYDVVSMPIDFNGNPVITEANLLNCFLTLYVEGEESIFRVPLVKLFNIFSNTATAQFTEEQNQFENLQVDWTKSYISLAVPFAALPQFAIILSVSYQRLKPGTMNQLRIAAGQSSCAVPGNISMM